MGRAVVVLAMVLSALVPSRPARGGVTAEGVERAIRRGCDFLRSQQQPDGPWPGGGGVTDSGMTALVSLALITSGDPPDSPAIERAIRSFLRTEVGSPPRFGHETYVLGLKAMVLASAPEKYGREIQECADRLARSQVRVPNRHVSGGWSYGPMPKGREASDNSNAQYALLGLHAAREAGARVDPQVFEEARRYWEFAQDRDGGWGYRASKPFVAVGTMTCAGVSSLIIAGSRRTESRERLVGDRVDRCGEVTTDPAVEAGIHWIGRHIEFHDKDFVWNHVRWKYYCLYGLERVGRLSGLSRLGEHDWYREGAEELLRLQDPATGTWRGEGTEGNPLIGTSFALLFLAKGRSPVLINKLKHGPARDWDNDHDDAANLTASVSRDWKHLLTWQVVDPSHATVEDLLQAPIAYLNGHDAPIVAEAAKKSLRRYVDSGGLILAEACCGRKGFDQGFRALIKEILPEPGCELRPLHSDHPVWRAKHELDPDAHPLWGIDRGCRTVVIYSPGDLSCYWHQMDVDPVHTRVVPAVRLGQNIVDYATGRALPADKLAAREPRKSDLPKRGALHIAKLRHGGDWNVAPLAIPHLTTALRDRLKLDVVIDHREMAPDDPKLVNFPLVYIHGRGDLTFSGPQKEALRRNLSTGGGTLFADAACGSETFDASFRRLAAGLFPDRPFEPIPHTDDFFARPAAFDLSDAELNRAAGGRRGLPELEGVRVDGHWAILYSKFDLGCSLQRHAGADCKGYTHNSAMRIAANIVLYATMP